MKRVLLFVQDCILNLIQKNKIVYVVEAANWSIWWDGWYIVHTLSRRISIRMSTTSLGIRSTIVHFGSISTFITENGDIQSHRSNKNIVTWYHVDPEDPRLAFASLINRNASIIHTSCAITKKDLINLGIDKNKIIVIPIGVDTTLFKPLKKEKKEDVRKKLGIPNDTYVIGSFQKDGVGWSDGLEPKRVKGPDIFCDVISKLAKEVNIHVLLTGPARGYVKQRLAQEKISYTHVFLDKYTDIVPYYNALDCYLITSRTEGGPKALLESWACGIPVVSTPVGMSLDIDKKFQYLYVSDNFTPDSILSDVKKVLHSGIHILDTTNVSEYSWEQISDMFYKKVYIKV